eukprot:g7450.t1
MRIEVIKIVVGFYALAAGLGETFGITWPSAFGSVLATIKAGFASVSQLTALSCRFHVNQYGDTCFWTFGLLVVLGAARVYAQRKSQDATPLLFYVALFAYPFVSPAVISIFICRTIAGTSYLVADYTIQCHTSTWKIAVAWCALWFALYVFGLPAAVAFMLRRGTNQAALA